MRAWKTRERVCETLHISSTGWHIVWLLLPMAGNPMVSESAIAVVTRPFQGCIERLSLDGYRKEELARLTIILITPDPTTGARSTSSGASQHTQLKEIAKDTLVCALDALAQSSDAFAPLKSVACGLMFFATLADVSISMVTASICTERTTCSWCLAIRSRREKHVNASRNSSDTSSLY